MGRPKGSKNKNKYPISRKGEANSFFGKKHTVATIEKIIKNRTGKNMGSKNALGYKHTEKTKESIRKALKGSNSHLWRGGISKNPYPVDWTETLRTSIRERDNYTCQMKGCNKKQGDRVHSVHHIDYNKDNCDPNNLITLCIHCHLRTNFNRVYWEQYFKQLII